jgi:hypothetical protein
MSDRLHGVFKSVFAILCAQSVVFVAMALPQRVWAAVEANAAPPTPAISKQYPVPSGGGVNLFTGDAEFDLPLAGISGQNGLRYALVAHYSSNVMAEVDTWNGRAPTGGLGLGWKLDFPKIVVETNNTGTTEDDRYYFEEGGRRLRLLRTGTTAGGNYVYQTEELTPWSITFMRNALRWEVVDENGIKRIYGDGALDKAAGKPQNTLQWGVTIDNWIGPTKFAAAANGATPYVVAYNLASIVEPWGDQLDFYYERTDLAIGSTGGLKYTRECYLSKVRNQQGDSIEMTYGFRTYETDGIQEYVNPHNLDANLAFYQDRYETRYLRRVAQYRNGAATAYSSTWLGYSFLDTTRGDKTKRILSSVQNFNRNNKAYGPAPATTITAIARTSIGAPSARSPCRPAARPFSVTATSLPSKAS